MAYQTFQANDLTYTVSPDTEVPAGWRSWALLRMQLIDEITTRPPRESIVIESPFPGLSPRVAPGGVAGFAGIPGRVFPLLSASDYSVDVSVEIEGFIPVSRTVTVLHVPAFPAAFAPTDMGTILLHRLPTTISGRVALNTGIELQGIAGATVTMTGLWRTPPPANLAVPPDAPDIVSLAPGLYSDRPIAGTQVQGLNFLGGPGSDKRLLQDGVSGQPILQLSDRVLIGAGDILAIDAGDPALTEYISIQSLTGASTPDQPATITLDLPLRMVHRKGAIVHRVRFLNAGVATTLTADAITGDVCLLVNGVNNLASAPLLAIQTGGIPDEYHAASYFSTASDANGFFRLPALSRVAQCALRAHDGAHPDLDITYSPDYSSEVSRVDFVYH